VLSHGTDFGNNAVYLSGNATVTLVDPQLVAHHGSDRSYIHADPTFSGRLDLYNGACWGSPDIAFRLMGPGSYHINQIHIANPGNDVFELQHGALTVNAAARFGATKYDVEVIGSAKSVSFSGSLCITKPVFSIPASVPTSGSDLEKKES